MHEWHARAWCLLEKMRHWRYRLIIANEADLLQNEYKFIKTEVIFLQHDMVFKNWSELENVFHKQDNTEPPQVL